MEFSPSRNHLQRSAPNHFPADWQNPTPLGRYNLVVVGGSSAGIVSALTTASLQGRVALVVEQHSTGDLPAVGFMPSQTSTRSDTSTRSTTSTRSATPASPTHRLGVEPAWVELQNEFAAAAERLRQQQAETRRRESPWRLTGFGVDVYQGVPRFVGTNQLEVDGTQLEFDRAVIATGSRPVAPNCPGLDEIEFQTSDSIFSLDCLPRTLVVLGSGPTACELAQTFRRFGSEVHLLADADGILPDEERQAAAIIQAQLQREGVRIHSGATVVAARKTGRSKSIVVEQQGSKLELICDEILVALGSEPNLDELCLESAGVLYSAAGIEVDDRLQTSNRLIYAAGDVCASIARTGDFGAMARLCVHNAMFFGRQRLSHSAIARCIYTDPQLAQVGLTVAEADRQGIELDSYRVELGNSHSATHHDDQPGFAVLHTRRGGGRVMGATIVAEHAVEMIGQISLLVSRGLPISTLSDLPHGRSPESEALARIADQYRRRRLTPRMKRLLDHWFTWRRRPRPKAMLQPLGTGPQPVTTENT